VVAAGGVVGPGSAGGRTVNHDELASLTDGELDEVAAAVRTEQAARGRRPHEPSFGQTEGEREELERTGTTVSPFTGVVTHRPDTACALGESHEGACEKRAPRPTVAG
jgi:hypothetical protein